MAKSQKKGGGGRKIGRNKRAATNALQAFRSAANKGKRVARKVIAKKPRIARGTARNKRREKWALVRTRVTENGAQFWKPTFAEFVAGAVSRPLREAA